MTTKDWIDLVNAVAWPMVGLGVLIYVWRSDAIGKLIKISDSVKDLNENLVQLVEAEQKLRQTSGPILEATETMTKIQADFLSIKADVENIRDRIELRSDGAAQDEQGPKTQTLPPHDMFTRMDHSWQVLMQALDDKFGWFDRRSVAGEVYRFAHGNRKGARLTYDQADEIARLHSSIKSYRRRFSSVDDWLDQETFEAFVGSCQAMIEQIRGS